MTSLLKKAILKKRNEDLWSSYERRRKRKKRGAALRLKVQRRVKRNRHRKKRRKKAKSLVVFKLAGYITATKTRAMWQCARLKAVAPDGLTSRHQRTNSKLLLVPNSFFFPGGESSHGPASEMQFNLANFKLQNISQLTDDQVVKYPFTVQRYFEVHKLTQARIYLASKRMSTFSLANEENEDLSTQSVPSSSSKTNPQRQDDRGRLWRQKYALVDNKERK